MYSRTNITMKSLSTLFFLGKISSLPGTLGSLFGMLLGIPLVIYLSFTIFAVFIILLSVIAYLSITAYTKDLQVANHDPKEVIIDEVLGQLISMTPILICLNEPNLIVLFSFVSFALFRFFDILKPWPIKIFDEMLTPLGVVLDDIAAGTVAAIILYFIFFVFL